MLKRMVAVGAFLAAGAFLPFSLTSSSDQPVRLTQNRACAQDGCGCISCTGCYCYFCDAGFDGLKCNFGCTPEPPE